MIGPKVKDNLNQDPQKILQCVVAWCAVASNIESHTNLPLAWDRGRACLAVEAYLTKKPTDFLFRRTPLFEVPQDRPNDVVMAVECVLKQPADSNLGAN